MIAPTWSWSLQAAETSITQKDADQTDLLITNNRCMKQNNNCITGCDCTSLLAVTVLHYNTN